MKRWMRARHSPCTRIFRPPSDSLRMRMMTPTVPTLYSEPGLGSSSLASRWATMKHSRSSVSSACFTASSEIGRDTRSGAIMYGKTTRSRTGSSGRTSGISSERLFFFSGSADMPLH